MPSIRFDRITPNLDTGRIATEETGASYEFATTPTLNAGGFWREGGSSREGRGFRYPVRLYPDGDSSLDSTRVLWITGVRAFVPWFVRACVQHTCVPRSKRPLRVTLPSSFSFGQPAPRAERSHSPFRSAATRSNGTTTLDISRARIAAR